MPSILDNLLTQSFGHCVVELVEFKLCLLVKHFHNSLGHLVLDFERHVLLDIALQRSLLVSKHAMLLRDFEHLLLELPSVFFVCLDVDLCGREHLNVAAMLLYLDVDVVDLLVSLFEAALNSVHAWLQVVNLLIVDV